MASLRAICYENIMENFYNANFIGLQLIVDKSTGYFNATKLCKLDKKSFKKWYRKSSTRNLFKFMKKNQIYGKYLKYKITGSGCGYSKISGTYLHQCFLLKLAEWISYDFYCKCNEIILDMSENEFNKKALEKENINNNLQQMIENMTETLNEKMKMYDYYNEDRQQELLGHVFEINSKVGYIFDKVE